VQLQQQEEFCLSLARRFINKGLSSAIDALTAILKSSVAI